MPRIILLSIVMTLTLGLLPGCGARSTASINTPGATIAKFDAITTGMSYPDVTTLMGSSGEELSRSDLGGFVTIVFSWKNADGSSISVTFENGAVFTKTQSGLR